MEVPPNLAPANQLPGSLRPSTDARPPGAEGPNVRRLSSEASGPADPVVARGGVSSPQDAAGNAFAKTNAFAVAREGVPGELLDEWQRVHHLRVRMEALFTKGLEFGLDVNLMLQAVNAQTARLDSLDHKMSAISVVDTLAHMDEVEGRYTKLLDTYALITARNSVEIGARLNSIEARLVSARSRDLSIDIDSPASPPQVAELTALVSGLVERVHALEAHFLGGQVGGTPE